MTMIIARIRNWYYKRKFRKLHGMSRLVAIAKFFEQRGKVPSNRPTAEYFDNETSIVIMQNQAYDLKSFHKNDKNIKAIAFGDSLIALCKNDLQSVSSNCNFARSGDTGRGFADIIKAVGSVLSRNPSVHVENVIIGCFGNNALQFQSPGMIIHEMKVAYDQAHIFFPDSRIIFYAFPPVYDLYANLIYADITAEMYKIAGPENVITFDDMRKDFIFPSPKNSSDGTHLSPIGVEKFDRKIMEKIG